MKKNKAIVIGQSVSKSLSPTIFNYWFSKYKIKGKYEYLEIQKNKLEKKIFTKLINMKIKGFNVTIPHKESIMPYLDFVDSHSKKIGAVNCVTIKRKKLHGSNTDWIGYYKTINKITKKQERVRNQAIVVGYGGASKAIVYALLKLKYKKIHIFNRTLNKMKNIKNKNIKTYHINEIKKHISQSNIIVNTIPVNIFKLLNIPKKLPPKFIVSDIVYRPFETSFLKHFKNPKEKTYGISMLINQAIPCFEKWFGFKPTANKELFEILKKELDK